MSARRSGSVAQVGEDRPDAAMLVRRRPEPELVEDAGHVLLDRRLGDHQMVGDAAVRHALRHHRQDVALPWTEAVQRPARAAAQHPPDDLGIERAAAGGDTGDRIGERLDVADALLEQVPDAVGALADELERVLGLVVVGEHEHAGLRALTSQLDGRAEPVIRIARWHLDVDEGDVGPVGERFAEKVLGVAGARRDLETGVSEQARDPFSQQYIVLADDHTQRAGHTTTVLPCPSRAYARASSCMSETDGRSALGTKPAAPHRDTTSGSAASTSLEVRMIRGGCGKAVSARASVIPSPSGSPTSTRALSGR